MPEPRRAKSKKSKAKEEENAHHAALEAAKLAVQEGSYVAIYSINEGGVPTQIRRLDPQGDQPKQIFGGPVIGIVGSRSTRGIAFVFLYPLFQLFVTRSPHELFFSSY